MQARILTRTCTHNVYAPDTLYHPLQKGTSMARILLYTQCFLEDSRASLECRIRVGVTSSIKDNFQQPGKTENRLKLVLSPFSSTLNWAVCLFSLFGRCMVEDQSFLGILT